MSDDQSTASAEKRHAACRAWRANNRERVAAYNKEWQEANAERKAAQQKARREANLGASRAKEKARYEANPGAGPARTKAYRERHPDRVKTAAVTYRKANPEKVKARKRRSYQRNAAQINLRHKCRKYGIGLDELALMLRDCGGRCPCCKVPFSDLVGGRNQRPVIDHDHGKGFTRDAVRGVICHQCNITIGHAGDDPRILRACARHLERFQKASIANDVGPTVCVRLGVAKVAR